MGQYHTTHKNFTKRGENFEVVKCTLLSANIDQVMLHKCATTTLQDYYGKCVEVSKKSGLKLVVSAEDQQGALKKKNLEIWKRDNDFAFCFKKKNKIYVVKVNNNELELEETSNVECYISNANVWFQKKDAGAGEHYYIQTGSGSNYLTVKKETVRTDETDEKKRILSWFVALSTEAQDLFTMASEPCNREGCTGM